MKFLNWLRITNKIADSREKRVLELEDQIVSLERARNEQLDINTRLQRDHEDRMRAAKHAAEDRVRELRHEVDALKMKAQAADEELGHLLKIRDEKRDIELERRKVELEREQQEAIAEVKSEYQDKVEELLEGQIEKLEAQYKELLGRLPDINVTLKGRIGGE